MNPEGAHRKFFLLGPTIGPTRNFFMRRYIFTDLERKLLKKWLAGEESAKTSVALDRVLDRTRMYKQGLFGDVYLLIHVLRKLKKERGFKR